MLRHALEATTTHGGNLTILRVSEFGGLIPKVGNKMLPSHCAVEAINCDLSGRQIAPMYDIKASIASIGSASTAQAASLFGHRVTQIPSTAAKVVGGAGSACYAAPSDVFNYTVAADDDLWYGVYIPSGGAVAGQGCIDLVFSGGASLNHASVVDQDLVSAYSGDLSVYAGRWFVRKIQLGGKTASDGAAITGKIITGVRLWQNHASAGLYAAYYAFVIVRSRTGANYHHKLYLLGPEDPDQTFTLSPTGSGRSVSWAILDDDEVVTQNYPVIIPQFPGVPRNKMIASLDQSAIAGYQRNVASLASHDAICSAGASASGRHFTFEDDSTTGVDGHKTIGHSGVYRANAYGWAGVQATATAPIVTAVGGVGPSITRAYVVTNVSEDGLESGPSAAHVVTGNRDAVWTVTPQGSWTGTDQFRITTPAGSLLHTRRVYRTPEDSDVYKYVGVLDDNDVSIVDAVLDANLGEDLPTAAYLEMPPMTGLSMYQNGMIGGILDGTQVCFCEAYQYHAWPLAYRYTIPMVASALVSAGDRLIALGSGKPIGFSGQSPDSLQAIEYYDGEPCISTKAVAPMRSGVMYAGATGWLAIDSGGVQPITNAYLTAEQYAALVSAETIAMFDGRRLYWITRGATQGYALEIGAQDRGLVKFEVPYAIYAMGYYEASNSRWISYWEGTSTMRLGKLNAETSQRLKWTWKSKLLRTARPVPFMVAQVESDEFGSLTNSMEYREGFKKTIPEWVTSTDYGIGYFVTNGGNTYRCDIQHTSGVFATDLAALKWVLTNTIYSITITGLTQAEAWCYLKVWADADNTERKVLVYDDFVVSDAPVVFSGGVESDCWQFELRGNINVAGIAIAETEIELNEE